MSDSFDTAVYGEADSCRTALTALRSVRKTLRDNADVVVAERRRGSDWSGDGGEAFASDTKTTANDCDGVADRVQTLITGVRDFADAIEKAESSMATVRSNAEAGGLTVSGTLVSLPDDPTDDQVTTWNTAVTDAGDVRNKEREAHADLGAAISNCTGDGFLENLLERLGLLPADYSDKVGLTGYLLGNAGTGTGAAIEWKIKGRYDSFKPRYPKGFKVDGKSVGGRFRDKAGMTRWERAKAAADSKNYTPKANKGALSGKLAKGAKILGHAGNVVTFATSAWGQWQADSDDPSMETPEKVVRAGTRGGLTLAGAVAGAEAGASGGAIIGEAIFPPGGGVVGGIIGGIIGGTIGGGVGDWVGSKVVDITGNVAENVSDWTGDRLDDVGDMASDVGDAITFWD